MKKTISLCLTAMLLLSVLLRAAPFSATAGELLMQWDMESNNLSDLGTANGADSDLSPLLAAAMGAYVHGAAGDISAKEYGEYSPLARDVLDSIPLVLRNAGGKSRWQ